MVCILLVLLREPVWDKLKGTGMRRTLLVYYLLTAFNWVMITALTFFPAEFVYVRILLVFFGVLVPVVLYHFLFLLTKTEGGERFPRWHYAFPAAFFLLHLAGSLSVPHEVFAQTSLYNAQYVPGYRGLYVIVQSVPFVRFLTGITYALLSLSRYRRYRRMMADYSSDLYLNSLYWLRVFLVLWIACLVTPVPAMFMPIKALLTQLNLAVPAVLLAMQHILLCFNVVRGNYIFPAVNTNRSKAAERKEAVNDAPQGKQIRQSTLERYMEYRKPYLSPNLTIVELAQELHTNRAYLSAFINKTYGMNYSQFINECRLKELDRIVADPESAGLTNMEKIHAAGFGSFDSYRRAVRMREKRKMLRPEE